MSTLLLVLMLPLFFSDYFSPAFKPFNIILPTKLSDTPLSEFLTGLQQGNRRDV